MLSFYSSSKYPYLSLTTYVFLQHVLTYITPCDFNSYEKWLSLCKIMLSVKILQRSLSYLCKWKRNEKSHHQMGTWLALRKMIFSFVVVVFGNISVLSLSQENRYNSHTYQHGRKVKNVFKECMRIKYVSHLFQIIVQSIVSSRQPLFNHFGVNQISFFHLLAFQANIKSQLLEILRQSPTKLSKNVTRENDTSVNW